MDIVTVTALSIALIVTACWLHYEVLRRTSVIIPTLAIPPRRRALVTVFAAFVAHILQICLYAAAYWLASSGLELGHIVGDLEGTVIDYLYFSMATFTTLGVGDVAAKGPIRLMAGFQALNGLVLITWSASFTYLAMERFWLDDR